MSVVLTGRFPAEDIRRLDVPRPPDGVIAALSAHGGLACLVSDVLDEMGLSGVLPAGRLAPVIPGRSIVGPALTLRKVRVSRVPGRADRTPRGDLEAHNLTRPGDVLVIQGHDDVSNMGGLSALTSQRQGALGAVIWGGCRDVAELRQIGYPVWSTAVTPVTGVGRVDGVELNGTLELGHVLVACGDIVVADDDGVCIIPRDRAAEVAERVARKAAADARRAARIRAGVSVPDLAGAAPKPEQG